MGQVKVPADKYWGAQTQRCLDNFKIGNHLMSHEIISAYAVIKKAVAIANQKCGVLTDIKSDLIQKVCDEIIAGKLDENFPLPIWQTGSGTHTNMNVNEVISNRAQEIAGEKVADKVKVLHPNDDVNKSQSSNDTFPTAMNIAAYQCLNNKTIPAVENLINSFREKSEQFKNIIKTGRTHMMDAAPISVGQEFSAFVSQLEKGLSNLVYSLKDLSELALGGTAVGTGLNAPNGFDKIAIAEISIITGISFTPAKNKFEALASNEAIISSHSALKQLATSLFKIINDLRLMVSGPRCGLNEISLPSNEPGSSIMPGKVNPTQIEAASMACLQIIANDNAVSAGVASGYFQLNVYRPLIIKNFLESASLLGDICNSLKINCIDGIKINKSQVSKYLNNSLMLVTALNTHIGYDKAAKIVKLAFDENITLKQACVKLGYLSEAEFDNIVNPSEMI